MTPPDPRDPEREVETGPAREAGTAPLPAAGFPVDHSREALAMTALHHRGFTGEFIAEGGELRLAGTDRRYRPEDMRIVDHYRFEGTSDPDDMSVIYALEAPDGTRGTLTDAFGAYADPTVGALLDRMRPEGAPVERRWRRFVIPIALGAVALSSVAVFARLRRAA